MLRNRWSNGFVSPCFLDCFNNVFIVLIFWHLLVEYHTLLPATRTHLLLLIVHLLNSLAYLTVNLFKDDVFTIPEKQALSMSKMSVTSNDGKSILKAIVVSVVFLQTKQTFIWTFFDSKILVYLVQRVLSEEELIHFIFSK